MSKALENWVWCCKIRAEGFEYSSLLSEEDSLKMYERRRGILCTLLVGRIKRERASISSTPHLSIHAPRGLSVSSIVSMTSVRPRHVVLHLSIPPLSSTLGMSHRQGPNPASPILNNLHLVPCGWSRAPVMPCPPHSAGAAALTSRRFAAMRQWIVGIILDTRNNITRQNAHQVHPSEMEMRELARVQALDRSVHLLADVKTVAPVGLCLGIWVFDSQHDRISEC